MTETLQDRLRQAADNRDHPPTFGLYFEAADRIEELEQAAKARADSDAEEDRRPMFAPATFRWWLQDPRTNRGI